MNLLCKLFGHKFWEEGWDFSNKHNTGIEKRKTDYCTRCMLEKVYQNLIKQ